MSETKKTLAVIEMLAGKTTVAEVARQHGATEHEVQLWKALYLDGAASALSASRPRATPRGRRWMAAAAVALVGALGFIGHARSQDAQCAQYLPAPLTTFCPGTPAVASHINGNFQQLVSWLEGKVGSAGAPGVATSTVTATSTVSAPVVQATSVTATTVNAAGYTPPYASWASSGTGAGGAAIYNDSSAYKTLMVVGNNAGGGPRRVGLWDDVTVNGTLRVNGNTSVGGRIYADGGLGARNCHWRQASPFDWRDNAFHTVECPDGYYMAGWNCYATDRLDGQCSAKCCTP